MIHNPLPLQFNPEMNRHNVHYRGDTSGKAAPAVRHFPEATVSTVDYVPAVFRRWCEGRRVLGCALCPRSLRNFRLVNG